MNQNQLNDMAALLLRVALGTMFVAHGVILKLLTYTLPGTASFFQSIGLPAWSAYAVFAAEAVGGAMLILGIQTRWVAIALMPILAGAIWVYSGNGWVFDSPGGGWEYPAYLAVLAIVQFLVGDGAFALSKSVPILSRRPTQLLPYSIRGRA